MSATDNISERERALRKELAQRTVNISSSEVSQRKAAGDPPELIDIGRKITILIEEERLEDARFLLNKELDKYPDALMLLNFQMVLDSLEKPFGKYDNARKTGIKLIEQSVKEKNSYYTMVGINNLGLIAHKEGQEDLSLAMYLAANYIDDSALFTMCNLAGWYSRKKNLAEAMHWITKIIETNPNWQTDEEITSFLNKDESLYNLRQYDEFKKEILAKIK